MIKTTKGLLHCVNYSFVYLDDSVAHYITIPSLPQSSLHSHRPYGKEGTGCYSKGVRFSYDLMEACIPSVVNALGKLEGKKSISSCFSWQKLSPKQIVE